MSRDDLVTRRKTAVACLLARHWPAQGGRHDVALALAGGLLRQGWSQEDDRRIHGPWQAAGDEETRDRVAAASYTADRLAQAQTATGGPTSPSLVGGGRSGASVARSTDSENSEHSESAWEAPIPLAEHAPPPFPTTIFPDWVRAFVEALAVATQTPPDLAAMLVLAVLAAACAKRFIVRVTQDWFEPVNLFTATALAPGERKSAVFRHVTAPMTEFEATEIARLAPVIAQAETNERSPRNPEKGANGRDKGSRDWDQAARLAGGRTGERVGADERAGIAEADRRRLLSRALASLLAEQGGRIAVMAPEGDVFDLMAGRYSATGMPNFGVYLRGHAGDDLRVDRVSRPAEIVPAPALTVGLAVQPEIIRGLAMRPGFRGRGLLGRFLY